MLAIRFIELVRSLPPEFATFILAMAPVTELRASIPVGLTVFHLSPFSVIFWSVFGNILPAILILWFIDPISRFAMARSNILKRFFEWLFERTRNNILKKHATFEEIALMIFVAIPLPLTGAWTGALAAWLFGIPKKQAAIFIFFGVFIAAIIVTLLSYAGILAYDITTK